MTRVDFERALAAHGGDLGRWPAELAAEARAVVTRDPAAGRELTQAAALDALLAQMVKPVPVDSATVGRIIAGISARHARERAVRPTARLLAWAGAAMAVFLVVGFVLGLAIPASSGDDAFAALFGADASQSFDVGEFL